ncbi:MAG TPA: CopD family protein [Candidatus Eisenbacteria bacterium]|nr:CopD family protein [Candidatus Eisenbacteria bacterium]
MSGNPDFFLALLHWIEYLGLLGGLGSIVIRRLAANRPPIHWVNPPMHIALGAAFLGGLAVVAVDGLHAGSVPGWASLARVGAEGLAFVFCVRGIPFVAPAAALASALLPFAGHAAAVQPPAGAEFADALHVLSAGLWAGGILALSTLRPPGGWRGAEARMLLDRFAGVALIAFAVTALTGVLRATEQLHGLSDLWQTPYGVVLSLKAVGVGIMLVLSSLGWRRGLPVARIETVLMVVVVAATALLASFPTPA